MRAASCERKAQRDAVGLDAPTRRSFCRIARSGWRIAYWHECITHARAHAKTRELARVFCSSIIAIVLLYKTAMRARKNAQALDLSLGALCSTTKQRLPVCPNKPGNPGILTPPRTLTPIGTHRQVHANGENGAANPIRAAALHAQAHGLNRPAELYFDRRSSIVRVCAGWGCLSQQKRNQRKSF